MKGTATEEGIVEEGLASLKRLNLDQVGELDKRSYMGAEFHAKRWYVPLPILLFSKSSLD